MFTYLTSIRPSLVSLMVSVDVKHHVYLLNLHSPVTNKPYGFCLDVKHHVYLLNLHSPVPNKPYGFCLDVKHHVYLLNLHSPVPNKPYGFCLDVKHHKFLKKDGDHNYILLWASLA